MFGKLFSFLNKKETKTSFFYNNQLFDFDMQLFKKYSDFSLIQGTYSNNTLIFPLITEFERCPFLTNETINTFLLFFKNQSIKITPSDAFPLYYLSSKYNVALLRSKVEQYITENAEKLFDKVKDPYSEKFISDLIPKIISYDQLLNFPISSVYRILELYFKKSEQSSNEEREIIDFFIKYINKHGKQGIILFNLTNFTSKGQMYFNEKIINNTGLFELDVIQKNFMSSLVKIEKKLEMNMN